MRLLLEGPGRTWSLEPGLTLIGSATDCHVRLDDGPPHAAALIRWFQHTTLYTFGTPPFMQVNGQPVMTAQLHHGDLLAIDAITLRVRQDPVPGRSPQVPEGADLSKQIRKVAEAGMKYGKEESPKKRSKQLLRVVSGVTGAKQAKSSDQSDPAMHELRLFKSDSLTFRLDWGTRDPAAPAEVSHRVSSLAAALDDFDRWEEKHRAPVLPYRDYTLRIRHQDSRVGAYGPLGWADLCHLDLPHEAVREPLILVTAFDETLRLTDLSASGALEVDGKPFAHGVVTSEMQVTLLGQPIGIHAHSPQSALLPMRIQTALGAPDDPITGAFSLGCLLATTSSKEERMEACLLAAITLSGAHAGALVWTGADESSVVATLVELSRHQSSGWMRSSGIPSRHLEVLVKRAIGTGEPQVSDDVLDDERCDVGGFRPGDPIAVVGGALAVPLGTRGSCLLLTRSRGRRPFPPGASRVAAEVARLMEPLDGQPRPPARIAVEPDKGRGEAGSWLRAGRLRIPLPQEGVLLMGRDEQCDVRITGDGTISRAHAMLVTTRRPPGCQVYDLRSSNGTFVEGLLVEQAPLAAGQKLTVGELDLLYEAPLGGEGALPHPWYCPVSAPIDDLQPRPLGSTAAPSNAEALEQALPALAMVAGASKARWVKEELFGEKEPPGHYLLVPSALGTGGWIVLDGLESMAEVRPEKRLMVQGEGIAALIDRPLWIGRGPECDLRTEADAVSRRHAILVPTSLGAEVVDARSVAGTRVNGQPVGRVPLSPGDMIEVGPLNLVVSEQDVRAAGGCDGPEGARALLRALAEARADSKDPLELLADLLWLQTRATSTAVAVAGTRTPLYSAGDQAVDAATWMHLEGAIEAALGSGSAVVEDLDEPRLYRPRTMSLMFSFSPFRTALVLPIPRKPPTVAVALTARLPRTAFEFGSVRWLSALISLMS